MTSTAGSENRPEARGAARPGVASLAMDVPPETLVGFLLGGLHATRESIESTLSEQRRMMDVVSGHLFGPIGANRPDLGPEEMNELVTALQSDDLIRQTLENLVRALEVMVGAVEAMPTPDGDGQAGPAGREWTAALLDVLLIEDLRRRFARRLEMPPEE